jgi:hypothetical protein
MRICQSKFYLVYPISDYKKNDELDRYEADGIDDEE